MTTQIKSRVIDARHPSRNLNSRDWLLWRLTYEGGLDYLNRYLRKFSRLEPEDDFLTRKLITPIPSFAAAALNDIRNSIYQRMGDIIRRGGSENYDRAVQGLDLGVDRRGSTMNAFMGMDVLTELLLMGTVGVYVDSPAISREDGIEPSLADAEGFRPYLYHYKVEDILSWRCSKPEEPSEFQSLLLRDTCVDYDQHTLLPITTFERFRLLWINQDTGKVNLQFINAEGANIDSAGNPSDSPIELNLDRIPFVMPTIGGSLMKDAAQYQLALLNLVSSDVSYALKANFPFYVEQRDTRGGNGHLRASTSEDGTAEAGDQGAKDRNIAVGATQGRAYDLKAERPAFIHPSPEPLEASMALQEKLESDIRKLMNLSVMTMASRQSAESKSLDNQGLEAGLSFIGLVLENTERKIADYWAAYETAVVKKRKISIVKYPDRYNLKSDKDRIEEAQQLAKLITSTPSKTARQEMWKSLIYVLLSGRINTDKMQEIYAEIDEAPYTTADPDIIIQAVEQGLASDETASMALGFMRGEAEKAQKDHAARIARIQAAQTKGSDSTNINVPGVKETEVDANAADNEKKLSQSQSLQPTRRRRRRGRGK